MDRRQFLTSTTSMFAVPLMRPFLDLGRRIVLLNRYYPDLKVHFQGRRPTCTAHAAAIAVEILNRIEHALFDAPSPREIRVAYLYEKSKMRGGGAAVKDVVDVLLRGFPFSTNTRARIKTAQEVTSWDKAADAVKSLQPVIISSRVGFNNDTDDEGFIRPIDNDSAHAWCLLGVDDRFYRPGGLLLSSWGETWPQGPTRHNQPKGSAWVDASVIDKMVSKYGKSYAISDLEEVESTKSTHYLFYTADWCSVCQKMKPIIAQFPEIKGIEGSTISPIPQLRKIVDDEVVATLIGFQTKEKVEEFVR